MQLNFIALKRDRFLFALIVYVYVEYIAQSTLILFSYSHWNDWSFQFLRSIGHRCVAEKCRLLLFLHSTSVIHYSYLSMKLVLKACSICCIWNVTQIDVMFSFQQLAKQKIILMMKKKQQQGSQFTPVSSCRMVSFVVVFVIANTVTLAICHRQREKSTVFPKLKLLHEY